MTIHRLSTCQLVDRELPGSLSLLGGVLSWPIGITDPTGAVVDGVYVAATNVSTNMSCTTASKSDGSFVLLNLGTYTVAASVAGYRETLCPIGLLQTGAVRSRCAKDLGHQHMPAGTLGHTRKRFVSG